MIGNIVTAINGTPQPPKLVTGGTLTSDATYYYRTFTSNGTLAISGIGTLSCDLLIIAGGAGRSEERRVGKGV